jgi:hypothetical protein
MSMWPLQRGQLRDTSHAARCAKRSHMALRRPCGGTSVHSTQYEPDLLYLLEELAFPRALTCAPDAAGVAQGAAVGAHAPASRSGQTKGEVSRTRTSTRSPSMIRTASFFQRWHGPASCPSAAEATRRADLP